MKADKKQRVHQVTMVGHRRPNAGHVVLVLNTADDAADLIEKLVHGLRSLAARELDDGTMYAADRVIVQFSGYVTRLDNAKPAKEAK